MTKQKVVRTRISAKNRYYDPDAHKLLSLALEDGWRITMCNHIGEDLEYILEREEPDTPEPVNQEKKQIIQKLSRVLEQSNAVHPTGIAPKQLAPGIRAYTTIQTFSGITIDFNMLARDIYNSGILKEEGWDG